MTSVSQRGMDVCFVTPTLAGAGAERVVINLANGLARQGSRVGLIALTARGGHAPLVSREVELRDLARPRVRYALPELLRALRRLQPAVVVASAPQLNMPLGLLRWTLPKGTALVLRESNMPSTRAALLRRPTHHVAFRLGYRYGYPRADAIITTSFQMREELVDQGAHIDRVHVVANPVDVASIRRACTPVAPVHPSGRYLIAVGRLVWQKGFDRLLRAFAQTGPEDRLVVLGEGDQRERLGDLARELGVEARIRFEGWRANPWAWIAGADALVLPSRTEGLPNVALEALACGTRVIGVPQAGGLAEVARVAPPRAVTIVDQRDLAAALCGLPAGRKRAPAPSLLPERFHLEEALGEFRRVCSMAIATRASTGDAHGR